MLNRNNLTVDRASDEVLSLLLSDITYLSSLKGKDLVIEISDLSLKFHTASEFMEKIQELDMEREKAMQELRDRIDELEKELKRTEDNLEDVTQELKGANSELESKDKLISELNIEISDLSHIINSMD